MEDRDYKATPSTLVGLVGKKDQENQDKHEEYESLIKQQTPSFKAQGPLVKINVGTKEKPKIIKVNSLLAKEYQC